MSVNNLHIQKYQKSFDTPHRRSPTIRYSFRFVSLIAPHTPYFTESENSLTLPPKTRRPLLKRSYLLASWLLYLSSVPNSKMDKAIPKIAILPCKQRVYTLTKAPMAHKTNSKEQFLFKFYNFKFSIDLSLPPRLVPNSINQGAHSLTITRKLFPVFETNLLFLKYYQISYPVRDQNFFKSLV